MSGSTDPALSELAPEPVLPLAAPITGDTVVDQALAALADLDDEPVDQHPVRLAEAHAVVRSVLSRPVVPAAS
ncbi:MAG: hypothetical protein LBL92_02135 [Propionibacteriaceae bacterium]|nr:hypothetical protein [Propionibacteriaceae bacterium]